MPDLYYNSTRSSKERLVSSQAIVKGIAADGGLFVPEDIPAIDRPFSDLARMDYRELAFYIMGKFLTDFTEDELGSCVEGAYDDKFDTPLIAPLVEKDGAFFLELYHGQTLAFKDMALSILPHLLKTAVKKLGIDREIIILTATSGDTGKAALEGFTEVEGTKIIVFYPRDGVSKIQERQMTTQTGDNTHVVAIEGNFDDAQRGVKEIFGDQEFNGLLDKRGYRFSSANSINIGRLIPQVVYYFYAYLILRKTGKIAPDEMINIVVPTGNFGNILSAYYAKKMGLPAKVLICASNENNVLYDFINTGIYNKKRKLIVTSSPSMDILVSSNLERLLYDLGGRDAGIVRGLIKDLDQKEEFTINTAMKEKLKSDFYGGFATDRETSETIEHVFKDFDYLIDTHTAVGYRVFQKYREDSGDKLKTVIASTASPFKFPGSVFEAISEKPAGTDEFTLLEKIAELSGQEVPESIKDIGRRKVIHRSVCRAGQMKEAISGFLGI